MGLTKALQQLPRVRLRLPEVPELAAAQEKGVAGVLKVQQPQRRLDRVSRQLPCTAEPAVGRLPCTGLSQ